MLGPRSVLFTWWREDKSCVARFCYEVGEEREGENLNPVLSLSALLYIFDSSTL